MIEKRQVGPLSTRAEVGSVDAAKRTVDLVWTTGAKVLRASWYDDPFYEELDVSAAACDLSRLNGGAPFLADHASFNVARTLGVVQSARIENGKGYATVRFARAEDDPEADQVFRKVVDGIIRNVSVGYRVQAMEKMPTVEGEKFPTMRVTRWTPFEISAVAIPADAGAGFRSAAGTNEVEISRGIPPRVKESNVTEEEKKAAEAKRQAEDQIAKAAALAERERSEGIRHACRVAKLDESFAAKMIVEGVTLEAARAQVLDKLATRDEATPTNTAHSGIEVGEEDRSKWVRGATLGMLTRTGQMPLMIAVAAALKNDSGKLAPGVRHAFAGFDPNDDGGEFRGMSPMDLARAFLERHGVKTGSMDKKRIMHEALIYGRSPGSNTGSDFAVLLENVMYKTLLGAYAQVSDTWREFCGTDSVVDFRPSNRYRTGSFGSLPVVAEGAEFQHTNIPDGLKFAITTQTYGQKIAISRQALINDDMGAIMDTIGKFGRSAGLTIEKAVYALLAQNSNLGPTISLGGVSAPLFDDSAWGNVSTGAALSMAALEADRVKMAQQKDISNNEYLDLKPAVLLVPESLRGEANVINGAKYDPTASTAFERPNIVNGLFRKIVSTPRLSGTRRYIFTDPGQAAALLVVFLNGSQAPFMDQRLGWDIDGTEFKLRLDMKAQAFDPKGGLTNAGT